MATDSARTICWIPTWNASKQDVGMEHLLLEQGMADSVVLAVDEECGPFRLVYRLRWDAAWQLRSAELSLARQGQRR